MAHDKTSSVKILSGLALAAAAAIAFTAAPLSAVHAADEAKVKCEGVNACKGTSECKTAKHDCAGKNACKGEGVKSMTKAECDAAKAKAHS
jgi:hypothetical protein